MKIVPLQPADMHSREALVRFLEDCRRLAAAAGRPQLVSITIESERLDPLAVLESIYEPGEVHFYTERVSADMAVAGAEAVISFTGEGEDRFVQAGAWVNDVLANTVAVGAVDLPFGGPAFFSGFTFEDVQGAGAEFAAAHVFVPRWQVARVAERSVAVANTLLTAETDIGTAAERIWRARAKFSSFDYTEPGFDGAIEGGLAREDEVGGAGCYAANVARAVDAIAAGRYRKVVLARARDLEATTQFHPLRALNALRRQFPDCYVFSMGNGRGASFIGASPERLAAGAEGRLRTEALAGSAPRGRTAVEDAMLARQLLASEKDVREQGLVLESIVRRLASVGIAAVDIGRARVRQLPNVQHLCTPIEAPLAAGTDLLGIVGELHPTPAVGGTPREAAVEHLRELEPFSRGLYAGVLGWVGHSGDGEYFVGIRSALIRGNRARVFAGAGIVEGSLPDREHAETELKMRALREALLGGT